MGDRRRDFGSDADQLDCLVGKCDHMDGLESFEQLMVSMV